MLRQHILLSGEYKAAKERNSRSGYLLDYDAAPLTAEELARARVQMSTTELDQIMEIAFDEASAISKQMLNMVIPVRPWKLTPLLPPPEKYCKRAKAPAEDDEEDGDSEDEDVEEDKLEEDELENIEDVSDDVGADTAQSVQQGPKTMDSQAEEAALYTARYAALSEDYEATLAELPSGEDNIVVPTLSAPASAPAPVKFGPPRPPADPSTPPSTSASAPAPIPIKSKILDEKKKVVVSRILDTREQNQSGTQTRSERVIAIDPKFALSRILNPGKKMSIKHASHHFRVVQAFTVGGKIGKTTREHRWQEMAKLVHTVVKEDVLPHLETKNVSVINPLHPGGFVIVKNKKYMYVGQLLDIYKRVGRRHGSIETAATIAGISYLSLRVYLPLGLMNKTAEGNDSDDSDDSEDAAPAETVRFSCRYRSCNLFTHAPAEDLLYNLGPHAVEGPPDMCTLKPFTATRWTVLSKAKVQEKLNKKRVAKPRRGAAAGAKKTAPGVQKAVPGSQNASSGAQKAAVLSRAQKTASGATGTSGRSRGKDAASGGRKAGRR